MTRFSNSKWLIRCLTCHIRPLLRGFNFFAATIFSRTTWFLFSIFWFFANISVSNVAYCSTSWAFSSRYYKIPIFWSRLGILDWTIVIMLNYRLSGLSPIQYSRLFTFFDSRDFCLSYSRIINRHLMLRVIAYGRSLELFHVCSAVLPWYFPTVISWYYRGKVS